MFSVFFFNDTATTEIYTLSLHDALPICIDPRVHAHRPRNRAPLPRKLGDGLSDRKSTRLNSSHLGISYAVFCLKKKYLRCLPCARLMHAPSASTKCRTTSPGITAAS